MRTPEKSNRDMTAKETSTPDRTALKPSSRNIVCSMVVVLVVVQDLHHLRQPPPTDSETILSSILILRP